MRSLYALNRMLGVEDTSIAINRQMALVLLEYYMVKAESAKSSKAEKAQAMLILDYLVNVVPSEDIETAYRNTEAKRFKGEVEVYVDGSAKYNNGPSRRCRASIAFAIIVNGRLKVVHDQNVGNRTSTEAEYLAVLHALEYLIDYGYANARVTVYSDSESVVRQTNLLSRTRSENLVKLRNAVHQMMKKFEHGVSIIHVPRHRNRLCNAIAAERRNINE